MNRLFLEARGLSYTHPGAERPAFGPLDFSLRGGELVCLCGVNGSGKSTLLAVLAGLFPGFGGSLLVSGAQAHCAESGADLRQRSALLLQDPETQIFGATVGEDLLLSFSRPDAQCREAARIMARRFGLLELWDEFPHRLSYGQKRKLCLAAALLRDPLLLLLDEPFSGLDYPAMLQLRELLLACKRQGVGLMVSTHDLEPVLDAANRLLFLEPDGRALFGPPEELLPAARDMGVRPPGAEAFA